MNENCTICGKQITGTMTGTGNGYAHRHCYEREHPPTPARTFYEVARGSADPIIAAEVTVKYVPVEIGEQIVREFNRRLLKQWQRRCEP